MITNETLVNLYERCLYAKYQHVENDGDFAFQREGDTLYFLLQWSHGGADWRNNFDFPAKPYKDMEKKWMCHRGFLRVWKSIKPYIKQTIADPSVKKIIVVGYSHGGALAALAHEYVWFNRPDLRDENLESYGFGAPRVFFGWHIDKELKERWKHFHPIRNRNDLVTHVPPVLFGFRHVNKVTTITSELVEKPFKLDCINSHCAKNYINSLYALTADACHGEEKKRKTNE